MKESKKKFRNYFNKKKLQVLKTNIYNIIEADKRLNLAHTIRI